MPNEHTYGSYVSLTETPAEHFIECTEALTGKIVANSYLVEVQVQKIALFLTELHSAHKSSNCHVLSQKQASFSSR